MSKIQVDLVCEILNRHDLDPETQREIFEEINRAVKRPKKRAAKPKTETGPILAKRALAGGTELKFVLPADDASLAAITKQIAGALEPYAWSPKIAAKAVLASIGIEAKGDKSKSFTASA